MSMVTKFVNDVKYFFNRLLSREGKPLLILSIIATVLAVLEVIIYVFLIRNSTTLNIPFFLLYTYAAYFLNRLILRTMQFVLTKFNVLIYQSQNFDYVGSMDNEVRRYNAMIYVKERDRFEATVIYILVLLAFIFIILTFVLNADTVIKMILLAALILPFFILISEPYEIIDVNANPDDLREMTKKDFFETALDKLFKEHQILSPLDVPVSVNRQYSEEEYYAQEDAYYEQVQAEQEKQRYEEAEYEQQYQEQYQEQQQYQEQYQEQQYQEEYQQDIMSQQPIMQQAQQQYQEQYQNQQYMQDSNFGQGPNYQQLGEETEKYNPFDDVSQLANQQEKEWWQH